MNIQITDCKCPCHVTTPECACYCHDNSSFKSYFRSSNRKPHKCPVCNGAGKLEDYVEEFELVTGPKCHACNGAGVLWG